MSRAMLCAAVPPNSGSEQLFVRENGQQGILVVRKIWSRGTLVLSMAAATWRPQQSTQLFRVAAERVV